MASIVHIQSGREGYRKVLRHVLDTGRHRSPRGMSTLDAGLTTIVVDSPYDALPLGIGRNISRKIAATEAVQLIGAFANPQLMLHASPAFKQFMDDDKFHGAYGERIRGQLVAALRKLEKDYSTRQAVITLWDQYRDNIPNKHDYPCTLSLTLSVRDNQLELDVVMRSNDAWLGFPYDIFQFTQLQLTAARALQISPGEYRHTALSLHLYGDHWRAARELVSSDLYERIEPQPIGLGRLGGDINAAMMAARVLPFRESYEDFSDSERWYWRSLRGRHHATQ